MEAEHLESAPLHDSTGNEARSVVFISTKALLAHRILTTEYRDVVRDPELPTLG